MGVLGGRSSGNSFTGGYDETVALNMLVTTKEAIENMKRLDTQFDSTSAKAKKVKADVAAIGSSASSTASTMNDVATSTKKVDTGLGNVAQSTNKVKEGFFSLNNIARTAFGTFTAMAIFFITKFVGDALSKTLDSLKQLELAFYKIGIAEKSLSKAGVDITPEDLTGIAEEVTKAFAFISDIDSMKMVGNLALLTKDLRLTKEQILDLAKAIPVLATSADISIESATDQVIGGLTKSGRGWADLGIQVDAAIIRQEAVSAGIVESAEAYDALTAEQKQQVEVLALIEILNKNVSDSMGEQAQFMDTVSGKTRNLSSQWEDFSKDVGVTFAPFIKSGLDLAVKLLQEMQRELENSRILFVSFLSTAIAGFSTLREVIAGNISGIREIALFFSKAQSLAKDSIIGQMQPTLNADTPTGEPQPITGGDAVEDIEDIAGALEKANEEIIKAELKLKQDLQDIAIDLGRKMVDITAEYAKKRADAHAEYNNKIGDINRDFNRKLEDIAIKASESRAKHQADQLEKEREFQNKLQEMREEFLMDLDDALHARDARQILKLIKQYNLEKLQAERKHALDMENSKKDEELRQQSFANERKQAEKEKRAKLEDAQRDYQLKLAKLKADEDAEVAAAVLAANRKTEDLMKANQDRLAIIAADLVNQFNLTKAGLDAVLNLYRAYYGAGGYISQVMAGMQMSMNGFRNNGTVPSTQINNPTRGSGGTRGGRAEGGTMIANKPTTVTFGEAGLEMAYFKPIGRNGKDENKIFSSLGGGGGSNGGLVSIELLLSPDLESRITRNTLGQAAEIVLRTSRSKG